MKESEPQDNAQSMTEEWLPPSTERTRLDVDLLCNRMQVKLIRIEHRRRWTQIGIACFLIITVGLGLRYGWHMSRLTNRDTRHVAGGAEIAGTTPDNVTTVAADQAELVRWEHDEAELAKLEALHSKLLQLNAEYEELCRQRFEQRLEIVREELSRTDLLSLRVGR
ncbi:MAG: hypothetical protein KDB03_01810 [Planctomycetales bacterium]|nr:hypothetical protein [Planctomycetales bacterium]